LPDFPSGDAVLTEAVLRADAVGSAYAVLIVEGLADKGVFGGWCVLSDVKDQVVVAGNKRLALGAHQNMSPEDRSRIVVVVDCDGDAGRLCGATTNLVVTTYNDLEADLLMLDNLRSVVAQLVGRSVSAERLPEIRESVLRRAIAAATSVEIVRHAARNVGISLKGDMRDLKFAGIREPRAEQVRVEAALDALVSLHSEKASPLSPDQVQRIERAIPGRSVPLNSCSGKVLLAAAGAVLHQDYRVPKRLLGAFDEVVRASAVADAGRREQLGIVRRIRKWESANGVRLFAP
jgi:hypothetical protein